MSYDPPARDGPEARRKATRDLQRAREQWTEVHEIAEVSRAIRRRNHLVERIEQLIIGDLIAQRRHRNR